MKLLNYDAEGIKVTDEALLIRPIRELYVSDKSKNKEEFWGQMSYLYFMCDPRSTYMYLVDESERKAEIKKQEGFSEDWEPSEKLISAMEQYKSHVITTSSLLLEDIRIGINNIRSFFRTVKLNETDKNGKPLYQVSSVTGAIKQAIELTRMLADAEKALSQDFAEEAVARGSVQPSVFEEI